MESSYVHSLGQQLSMLVFSVVAFITGLWALKQIAGFILEKMYEYFIQHNH